MRKQEIASTTPWAVWRKGGRRRGIERGIEVGGRCTEESHSREQEQVGKPAGRDRVRGRLLAQQDVFVKLAQETGCQPGVSSNGSRRKTARFHGPRKWKCAN